MRAFLPLCALLALPGLNAQIVITERAPAAQPAQPVAAQDSASAALFFKAFYLAEGARQYDQAIDLYKQFLAAAPKSAHAPRAARSLVNLLYRTDKVDAAEAAKKEFAALLEQAPVMTTPGAGEEPRPRGERQRPPRGEGQPREGQGAGQQTPASAERIEARKKQIKEAEGKLAEAKAAGDEEAAQRLAQQIQRYKQDLARLEGSGGAGAGQPGGRQGRQGQPGGGGRGMMRPFADMSQEEATQAVERMEGMVDRIREMQGDEAAKRMEESVQKIKGLIKEGKLAEADKVRAEMMPQGGAGGRGAGGRGAMRPLTDMTKEEALQSIERLEGMVDRMRENQGDEAAKKAEESIKKIKDLIQAGKLEEAEKARQEMTRTMFRRGG